MRKIQSGHPGLLACLDDFLLRYVFELHEQGMVVMMQVLSKKACDLCRIFHAKSDGAKSLNVYKWLKAQGLRYQMGTHKSHCSPAEASSDAFNFMEGIRKKVSETNCEKICYQYGSNSCLLHLSLQTNFGDERHRDKHHLCLHAGHKMGHSSVTVCVNGTKLPPKLIFKGKQNSMIAANEVPMFSTDCECFCQENAWMNEDAILECV